MGYRKLPGDQEDLERSGEGLRTGGRGDRIVTGNNQQVQEMVENLEHFLVKFTGYGSYISVDQSNYNEQHVLVLQRMAPLVTDILIKVNGNRVHNLGHQDRERTSTLLGNALMGGNNAMPHIFAGYRATIPAQIEEAIGRLQGGLWSPEDPAPVLTIHDEELRDRCSDLLNAPRNYDRVIEEATRVLENRIRTRVPHEVLSQLIPNSGDQTGENLINKLFSINSPVLSISDDRARRVGLRNMLIGVVSYLRNPSHHVIDDQVDWSWAWSTIGLIDRLMLEVGSCSFVPPSSATG